MSILYGNVAFFDSGIGGLTVLAECEKRLPNVNFYYYGDNEHAPYGNLSKEEMRPYVMRAFDAFARLRVDVAVIACNTVTALFAEELRSRYPFSIVGAEPAIRVGAKVGGNIYVLTTRATYESARFRSLCVNVSQEYPQSRIKAFACDGLAGEIERQVGKNGFKYAHLLPKGTPNAVVLGCTHYIYIESYIHNYYKCPVFHGNQGIADRLFSLMAQLNDKGLGFSPTNESASTKNRDKKPLLPIFTQNSSPKIKICKGKKLKVYKANKCSFFKLKKAWKYKGKRQIHAVRFLGKSGDKNLKIYERMFAFL